MKSSVLANNPAFYEEAFRKDVTDVLSADDEFVDQLETFLNSVTTFEDLASEKSWVALADATGNPIDELLRIYRPLRYIAVVSEEDKIELSELLGKISYIGLLGNEDKKESAMLRLRKLCLPVKSLISRALEEGTPALPTLTISSTRTRCNVITQFVNEFSTTEDTPDTYSPEIKKLHPYTTLELEFQDEKHESIVIGFTEKHLDQMIKWLQLARKQQQMVKASLKQQLSEDSHA